MTTDQRQKKAKCPNCGKPVTQQYHPFCSKRCADLDLGRWLDGSYRVETEEESDDFSANSDLDT